MIARPCKTDWTSQAIVLAPEVSHIWGQNHFLYAILELRTISLRTSSNNSQLQNPQAGSYELPGNAYGVRLLLLIEVGLYFFGF